MTAFQDLIATHPDVRGSVNDALARAIEQAGDCALACSVCADACLAEPSVAQLVQCIRVDLDCANICRATVMVAARRSGSNEDLIAAQLDVCIQACRLCAEECDRHAEMHEHCRLCAEACRACEAACREARDTFSSGLH